MDRDFLERHQLAGSVDRELGLVALTRGLLARLHWNCRDRGQACKLKGRVWRRKTGGSVLLSQAHLFCLRAPINMKFSSGGC